MRKKIIIVVGHGNFSTGISSALETILGNEPEHTYCVDIDATTSNEEVKDEIKNIIEKYSNDLIVVLTDIIIGSSTQNAIEVISHLSKNDLYLITGINLSLMLSIYLEPIENLNKFKINELLEQNKNMMVFVNEIKEVNE